MPNGLGLSRIRRLPSVGTLARRTLSTGGGSVSPSVVAAISKTADGSAGQTYTATTTPTSAIQWCWSDGTNIAGATSATYVAQASDIGKRLAVKVGGSIVAVGLMPVPITPLLIWDCDSASASGVAATNGSVSADTTRKKQGAASLKTSTPGSSTSVVLTKTGAWTGDPSTLGVLTWAVDQGDEVEYANLSQVELRLGTTASPPASGLNIASLSTLVGGFSVAAANISEFTALNGVGTVTLAARFSPSHTPPYAEAPRYDALVAKSDRPAIVMLTFDDCRPDQYERIYPLMRSLGLPFTLFIPTDNVGMPVNGQPGRFNMTWAQLAEMYASGSVDLGCNGTGNDGVMTDGTYATADAAAAETARVRSVLASHGFTRGANSMCYPNGSNAVYGTITQKSGITADGSATITMTDTTGITDGMVVAGAAVPRSPRTTVLSHTSTTVTLSAAASAGSSLLMSFTDTSVPFHANKLLLALQAQGFTFGRQTNGGFMNTRFGQNSQRFLNYFGNSLSSTGGYGTASNVQAAVEVAKVKGASICIYGHTFPDTVSSGLDMAFSEFTTLANYLKTESDAGRVVVTTPERMMLWDGQASYPF